MTSGLADQRVRPMATPRHREAISRRQAGSAVALSFAQERLWFIDRLKPGSAAYNETAEVAHRSVASAHGVAGPLDCQALQRALSEIVRRHEALRTVFRDENGAPVQVVLPAAGVELPTEDLSTRPAAERDAEVRRQAMDQAAPPFDLAAGPLLRARLLRLASDEHLLLLCMHHIVGDEWSMGVFCSELTALYDAYRAGRPSPLPELSLQYVDYAAWQRQRLDGPLLERQLTYWKERLAGMPDLLELPTDRPRPAVQSDRGARESIDLPLELLASLHELGRRQGATLYMVLLCAFQILLARYSNSDDVVVGSMIAGRTRRELEPLIGIFVNTLVLRTDLSGDVTVVDALRRVGQITRGAYEHQDLPFERLVAELKPERTLSHSPLFQVMFELRKGDSAESTASGFRLRLGGSAETTTKFDLMLGITANERQFRARVTYSTELFERRTVARTLQHFTRVLEQMVADPLRRLSAIDLLTTAERTEVVETWNQTAVPVAPQCVHEL
ncbi:MAG TPA: condensation domain-containing protein, partial [Vicinamibacterales bacterium]|nr:condensation domain-containing protein [Vicinamibacterales bacterium]